MKGNTNCVTYLVCGSAPNLWPAEILSALLYYSNDDALEIPIIKPFKGEWGKITSIHVLESFGFPFPNKLDIIWLAIIENKIYSLETALQPDEIREKWFGVKVGENDSFFTHFVVGMAPYGNVALWMSGEKKSLLFKWMKSKQFEINLSDFKFFNNGKTPTELSRFYIDSDFAVKDNLQKNGLPPHNLFDKYMQQFCYRYVVKFDRWNRRNEEWGEFKEGDTIPVFDYIEEALFDGTHDKLHDGGLLKYHEAGKPKKLAIAWHINKSEYVAYFWFEDEEIRTIYDRFYGVHPDTQVDFIIHIDAEKKKYQLALYRSGLQQPVIIPERAYQLIVFKSKFENYRSDNYNQESGAWIW